MNNISIAVAEEDQPVALDVGGLGEKLHAAFAQLFHGGVEIVHGNGQVTNAWVFHFLRRAISFRGDELQQRTVAGAHEIIAAVSVIDAEIQLLHVPLRQPFGIGRRDGGMLQSLKHKPGLYQTTALRLRASVDAAGAQVAPGACATI